MSWQHLHCTPFPRVYHVVSVGGTHPFLQCIKSCVIFVLLCDAGLCQSGGTCQNTPGSFLCTCPPGVTGHRCQYRDVCVSSSCTANSTCVHTITSAAGFVCQELRGSGQLLTVTVAEGGAEVLGQLDDVVNSIQETSEVWCGGNAVEHPIKNPPKRWHNRNSLSTKGTLRGPLSHSANTFLTSEERTLQGEKCLSYIRGLAGIVYRCTMYNQAAILSVTARL